MNIFEIIAGIALLLGWQSKLITWLLLVLIIFFTFLTGYAVLSGKIKTCGCFGDCIPLQAHQSFMKDLVLLALILVLLWKHRYISTWLPVRANLFILLFFTGLFFWMQLNVLKHLPYVDCLPYAKGKNLLQQMAPPAGSIPDSVVVMFQYNKDGKPIEFDANSFPDDFDETKYQFTGRYNKVIRKGNAEPAIKDFALYTQWGTDTTKDLLATNGRYLLFFGKDFNESDAVWNDMFTKVYLKCKDKGVPLFVVTNQPENANKILNSRNKYAVPVLTSDGTVMKTMLRSNTGIVGMQGAVVMEKYAEADMNEVIKLLNK
jgi:hypothetical protein